VRVLAAIGAVRREGEAPAEPSDGEAFPKAERSEIEWWCPSLPRRSPRQIRHLAFEAR